MNRRKRKLKRILTVWAARAAVIIAIAITIFGIVAAIKAIASSHTGKAEKDEVVYGSSTETSTQAAVPETEEPEKTEEPTTQASLKFQDIHSMDWDAADAYLLAKIAMAEAEGESTEGKAMVIMVVLNRVFDEGFEDTIEDVIYEHHKNSRGVEVYQFASVAPGGRWYSVEPDADCWQALRMIEIERWDESEGALYFEATWNDGTWHRNNLEYIKTVGNHNFYK